jgi:hypothetical protein
VVCGIVGVLRIAGNIKIHGNMQSFLMLRQMVYILLGLSMLTALSEDRLPDTDQRNACFEHFTF